MKVCPKCGYVETVPWRQNRWRVQVEFCWLEQFKDFYPEISTKLLAGEVIVCDEIYAYRLAGKGKNLVERILKTYYEHNGPKVFQKLEYERFYRRKLPRQQTRLLEVSNKQ